MLPGGRKDLLQKGQSFGIFARLIFIQEARKDGGVVIGGLSAAMERKLTLVRRETAQRVNGESPQQ